MKRKWVTCGLLVLAALVLRLPAQEDEALRKRFEETKAKAEKGDAVAQFNLGSDYFSGQGVAEDKVEAVKWYRKAAEQNVALFQYNLGCCYRDGMGVTKDEVEAARWFRKAAEQH